MICQGLSVIFFNGRAAVSPTSVERDGVLGGDRRALGGDRFTQLRVHHARRPSHRQLEAGLLSQQEVVRGLNGTQARSVTRMGELTLLSPKEAPKLKKGRSPGPRGVRFSARDPVTGRAAAAGPLVSVSPPPTAPSDLAPGPGPAGQHHPPRAASGPGVRPLARWPEAGGVASPNTAPPCGRALQLFKLRRASSVGLSVRAAAAFNGRASKKSLAHKCSQHDPMPRLISARRRPFARPGLLSLTPLEHRSSTWCFMRDSPSWVFVARTCDSPTAHCKGRAWAVLVQTWQCKFLANEAV